MATKAKLLSGIALSTGTVTLPANSTAFGLLGSTSAAVTAAGTNQATATVLTSDLNIITTSTANTGVVVPGAVAGKYAIIVNRTANAIKIYPASGHSFDGLAVNIPISLLPLAFLNMYGSSTTQWHTTYQTQIQDKFIVGSPQVKLDSWQIGAF